MIAYRILWCYVITYGDISRKLIEVIFSVEDDADVGAPGLWLEDDDEDIAHIGGGRYAHWHSFFVIKSISLPPFPFKSQDRFKF